LRPMKNRPSYMFGVGPTRDLSLRVSVAVLARVLFKHPVNGTWMLALERKATLRQTGEKRIVRVEGQPFGGAVQIKDLVALRDLIGEFRFDSERSRSESDFRLFIQPESWQRVRVNCIELLRRDEDVVLDTDPSRELVEEFFDTLRTHLSPDQFSTQTDGIFIEDYPSSTTNTRARGFATVRVYQTYEARIQDVAVTKKIVENTDSISDRELYEMALRDYKNKGRGRANAALALPYQDFLDYLSSLPFEKRNEMVEYKDHNIASSVFAILDGVANPKYRRYDN